MPHALLSFLLDLFRLLVWLVVLAAIFVPLERLFALQPRRIFRAALWEDIGLYFLSGLLPAFLLGFPMALVVALAHRIVPGEYYAWVDALPLGIRLLAAFVIGDIGFYWAHRWTHEVPLLWRFHAVHHRPDGLDWLINTRAHPVDLIFVRLCGLTPLYLLGLANTGKADGSLTPILVVLVGTIWGFLIHANVRWRLGWIEQALASPHFHHWHHTKSGPINRNYAAMLPVLDRVFGTFHHAGKAWPDAYGIQDVPPPPSAKPSE